MGKLLSALLHLQTIERQLVDVRNRLRIRQNAVTAQQQRIDQIKNEWGTLDEQRLQRRKEADMLELELKEREDKVASLRGTLNTAKTNKEYATILTQINTLKADNAKLEDKALRVIQEVDNLKAEADEKQAEMDREGKRLEEIAASSSAEIERLNGMMDELTGQRTDAAREVPPDELALFERIATGHGGDAMAAVEIHGSKPPYDYVCGGCFWTQNSRLRATRNHAGREQS